MSDDCFYCKRDHRLNDLMIEICQLEVSTFYLFKEQTYRGRCIVAYNKHVSELFELQEKELALFMQDVTTAARAIKHAFSPDKINYGAYSDKLPHLHFHLVPKYKDGYTWGSAFEMMPPIKCLLDTSEYLKMIGLIKKQLGKPI
jgi:ATP adenylyltransferase